MIHLQLRGSRGLGCKRKIIKVYKKENNAKKDVNEEFGKKIN